jgi:hypothetical protein
LKRQRKSLIFLRLRFEDGGRGPNSPSNCASLRRKFYKLRDRVVYRFQLPDFQRMEFLRAPAQVIKRLKIELLVANLAFLLLPISDRQRILPFFSLELTLQLEVTAKFSDCPDDARKVLVGLRLTQGIFAVPN